MDTMVCENRTENAASGNGNSHQTQERFVAPMATVLENGDSYTLQVEMPGVNKEGLEMWVESNELTIIGRRSLLSVQGNLVHREMRRDNFRRAFELDPSIDAANISAKIEHGVVTLTLPKAEQVKPRKITVS